MMTMIQQVLIRIKISKRSNQVQMSQTSHLTLMISVRRLQNLVLMMKFQNLCYPMPWLETLPLTWKGSLLRLTQKIPTSALWRLKWTRMLLYLFQGDGRLNGWTTKKLYDEAYGNASSDSSDDEEWSGKSTPGKGNEEQSEADSSSGKFSRTTRIAHHSEELTPVSPQKKSASRFPSWFSRPETWKSYL
uniref:Hox1b n=1 Tax=Arundo donax TaxID=35708 RepID=A0A0A9DPX6_ARUDO